MNSIRIILIIILLNVVLAWGVSFAAGDISTSSYSSIYGSTQETDLINAHSDFIDDSNVVGTGTASAEYEATVLNGRKSSSIILGTIKNGLRGIPEEVYAGSDLITRIVFDALALIKVLSGVIVIVLLYQLFKNRKTD